MNCEQKEFINVALYVDYENVHKALLSEETNMIRLGFYEKIRIWCQNKGRRIVKIAVYCNFDNLDLHNSYHQSLLQNYGVETIHTSNQGKNFADLQITIDVLNAMYLNNNIDEFIIMSNDKDMTPLLNTIRLNKRKVSIITTGNEFNKSICSFADEHICFNDVILNTVAELKIHKTEQDLWDKIQNYINSNYNKYQSTKAYNHYGLEYCLSNELSYTKVMLYELANMINNIYKRHELLFYNYTYNSRSFIAILPCSLKDTFIDEGLLKEEDIIDNYDMDAVVKLKYGLYK